MILTFPARQYQGSTTRYRLVISAVRFVAPSPIMGLLCPGYGGQHQSDTCNRYANTPEKTHDTGTMELRKHSPLSLPAQHCWFESASKTKTDRSPGAQNSRKLAMVKNKAPAGRD